jgi:putative chitinase
MQEYAQKIINKAAEFGITNKLELAHMLARFSVETSDFTKFSESLNYSSDALLKMFPKYITAQESQAYGRNSQHPANQVAIANEIYGSRMGNEANGTNDNDGYEYRGGGATQLTGKGMYASFLSWLHNQGKQLQLDISNIDDWIRNTEDGQIISGIWYWTTHNCGKFARADDVAGVCKAINGGTNGLAEQKIALITYKKALGL